MDLPHKVGLVIMNKKLEELSKQIDRAKVEEDDFDAERAKGSLIAMRIISELLAGILVGIVNGYLPDEAFIHLTIIPGYPHLARRMCRILEYI